MAPGPLELLILGGLLIVGIGIPALVVLGVVMLFSKSRKGDSVCQDTPDPPPGAYRREEKTGDAEVVDPSRSEPREST